MWRGIVFCVSLTFGREIYQLNFGPDLQSASIRDLVMAETRGLTRTLISEGRCIEGDDRERWENKLLIRMGDDARMGEGPQY